MKTDFTNKIYEIAKRIPKGKVATYKQLAELAGNNKAARAVGMAMKHNPFAPTVPCHRVVASNGKLTGFSAPGGIDKKKAMLLDEGVVFIGNNVDLTKSQWIC